MRRAFQGAALGGAEEPFLKPMAKALSTLERHAGQVVRRWISGLTNARLSVLLGERFERIAEIINQHQEVLTAKRACWRTYKSRGYPVKAHQLKG